MKQQPDTVVGDGTKITGARWWNAKGDFGMNRLTVANLICPYGRVGNRLWVREKCRVESATSGGDDPWYSMAYAAGGGGEVRPGELPGKWFPNRTRNNDGSMRWQPSIHMPRWASRITVEIVAVRVEPLHEITNADCLAEGIEPIGKERSVGKCLGVDVKSQAGRIGGKYSTVRQLYSDLWTDINGAGSWSANPWVWVVEFARI